MTITPDEFPGLRDPTVPSRSPAAHEYNHILQFGYDSSPDTWMFESSATWAEDKVFTGVNDWHLYMRNLGPRPPPSRSRTPVMGCRSAATS